MSVSKSAVLETTEAVGSLVPGTAYRFLFSPSWSPLVYLVEFCLSQERELKKREGGTRKRKKQSSFREWRAVLHSVSKATFESKLASGNILLQIENEHMPPWLSSSSEEQLIALEGRRRNPKQFHDDRIDKRFVTIYEASTRIKEFLLSEDPIHSINLCAKEVPQKTSAARFRLWLFSYLLYGRIGLHYAVQKIGNWDRKQKAESSPGSSQQVTGERAKKIVDSYLRYRAPGLTRVEIYVLAMTKTFECRSTLDRNKTRALYHPAGDWFPSLRSFFYHVDAALGHEEVERFRLGAKRHHVQLAPDRGSYTEFTGNAYEWVEYDPFHGKQHPRSNTGKPLPKLSTGRLRDAATGAILGLGFDLSGETKEQLGAALFCAAIDKVKFASLFGVRLDPDDWPICGLPTRLFLDRGAGFTVFDQPQNLSEYWPQVVAAPKGVGQAKATVETSHPKRLRDMEGPHQNLATGSVWQLVKNEILRVIRDNESFDVSHKIPGTWLESMHRASPNALYCEFDRRGRSDAVKIPFETAVRSFLPLIDVTADKDGVYLGQRRYQSQDLLKSGFFNRLARIGTIRIKAFHLRACINHIWILDSGKLFELTLTFKVRNGSRNEFLSLDELLAQEEMRNNLRRINAAHRIGVLAEINERSEKTAGSVIDSGTRVEGRRKRNRETIEEERLSVDAIRGKL